MKICYLIDAHTILSQRIAEYFASKGHEILILSNVSKYPNNHNKIKVKNLGFPKRSLNLPYREHLDNIIKVKREISKFNPDVVHGHYITSVASHIITVGKKYPVFLSAWGSDILIDMEAKHHKFLIKQALKRADKITSVAGHITDKLIDLGIDPSKIVTFPFGVNLSIFRPDLDTTKLREKYNIKPNEQILISTRMLEPIYNIDALIKSMKDVVRKIPTAKLIIAGTGTLENELRELTGRLGLAKNIIFVGFVKHELLPTYLNLADVYISSSLSDGTSASLLEAMACGLYPIVTDLPANKDWIDHARNGLLFTKNDYKNLSNLIIKALTNPAMRKEASQINIKMIKKKGEWAKNMADFETLYSSISA
jgi:glycosyltransferase involved in cell wall biosynthesis